MMSIFFQKGCTSQVGTTFRRKAGDLKAKFWMSWIIPVPPACHVCS